MAIPFAIVRSTDDHECDVDEDGNTTSVHRSIVNIAENKHYEWKNMLKGVDGSWCVGSSDGWLVILDKDAEPHLRNPFSGITIHLPPFPYAFINPYFVEILRKKFVMKAALMCSSSPSSSTFPFDYTLVIIYGTQGKIAFCKSKSQRWEELSNARDSYCDIVFFNNYLCALTQDGSIETWNFGEDIPTKVSTKKPTMDMNEEEEIQFPRNMFSRQLYLVVTEQEILLVARYIGNFVNDDGVVVDEGYLLSEERDSQPLICPYRTKHFSVYKHDLSDNKWVKVRSLHEEQALFIGANESTSISIKEFQGGGCEGNSIYFTDDRWEEMSLDITYGGHDWGIFSLKVNNIKLLTQYEYPNEYEHKVDPPPIWAIPIPIQS